MLRKYIGIKTTTTPNIVNKYSHNTKKKKELTYTHTIVLQFFYITKKLKLVMCQTVAAAASFLNTGLA